MAREVGGMLLLAGLMLLVSLPLVFGVNASGLGVSPSEITVLNALRDGEYQKTVTIFNAVENATDFLLKVEGDISDWITFYSEDNLTAPRTEVTIPGNGNKKVFVRFRIPKDAANGNYSCIIYAQTSPVVNEGTVVVIRAPIEVTVQVTGTQILAGTIRSIATRDTEVNYPLRIEIDFQNTGNVIANPQVKTFITRDLKIVDNLTFSGKSINPDSGSMISVEWNATVREPGDYTANVTVILGEEILMEKDLPFKLLPLGTLTRKGELLNMSTTEKILHSKMVKILATFKNTGLIDTMAKFVGEVYKDGNLIDLIESEKTLVEVGSEEAITSYLKINEEGIFVVKGYVVYDGKKTETKEMRIEVRTDNQPSSNPLLSPPALGLVAGLSAITTLKVVKARRKGKRKTHSRAVTATSVIFRPLASLLKIADWQ